MRLSEDVGAKIASGRGTGNYFIISDGPIGVGIPMIKISLILIVVYTERNCSEVYLLISRIVKSVVFVYKFME